MHQWLVGEVTGIVAQEFGGKIVRPVKDQVIPANEFQGVPGCQPIFVHDHGDIGVERLDLLFRRAHLGPIQVRGVVDHLTLEVGEIHHVTVDDPDRSDPGCCQVERRR